MPVQLTASPVALPLADCSVRAGFPSPAEDFSGKRLDIAELLVEHPQATFLLRVAGPSMREYGIDDGDMIVVDRALRPRHGSIVVAVIDSDFTVKVLHTASGSCKLRAGNPTYPDIVPKEGQTLEIWGVVTSCIKRFAR
ncbi:MULTISPECIES: translesion error-prone DNA polymerase V autoproteolytic subunit [unclassified Comamonas]|uniref:LexA family protein n=1 Tax=unclassified Comamonas TaxID=2638500 RepID=UPI001FA7584F|nr:MULTISPECIES: translesion error-prone DNA polymerase V autoproteolytic subunit [unclassified Comamonas]UNV89503.1 translesion error-prone DNA polymerase V autoproteolytic subunit [Comamonas sp. 7D-2evo1]UNV97198.1 translesion error-prone DNA polymerase V autoproteolytic subunit [Comamonas sp. 7D-2]UNV99148.1 translesion error-prone DNA polymerase V autoproteolytic subunit [Comamonas sp. 7D-2evo2]